MRIAVVGVPYFTGGGTVTRALAKFLRTTTHEVQCFDDYYSGPRTRWQQFVRRALGWRLGLKYRQRIIEKNFATLVENVRVFQPQVVIALEQGEILLRDLGGARKIFYANAPTGHEVYYQLVQSRGVFDWEAYRTACRKEVEYYQASDAVIFCWNTHAEYVRRYVYQGNNIVLHPGLGWYGCEPQTHRVHFNYPPFLVYLGSTAAYWNNADLLAKLAKQVSYGVHIYGPTPPPAALDLNYQGFAETTDVLLNYQIGLHTATGDLVRRFGFASKVMSYLAYGLPVLSPEWQLMSHHLRGLIPYNENNFVSLVESLTDPSSWQTCADESYVQARELEWSKVLAPLLNLIGSI